jgi:hypothetical protein
MPASRMPRVVAAKLLIHDSHHAHNHKINQWISWTSSPPLTLTWVRYHPSFYIRVVISSEGWQVLSWFASSKRDGMVAMADCHVYFCDSLYSLVSFPHITETERAWYIVPIETSWSGSSMWRASGRLVLRSTVAHLYTMTIEMRHFPSYSAYDYTIHYLAGQHRYD